MVITLHNLLVLMRQHKSKMMGFQLKGTNVSIAIMCNFGFELKSNVNLF